MSARPKPPAVPLETWRSALDAILAFRALAPWAWMADSDICVVTDEDGVPWFASVLGAAGQVFGLALNRGEQGLRALQRMQEADGPDDWEELQYQQDGITIWFGSKSELEPIQRERYAALDYRPARGARLAWPSVLNHRPGYVPWAPDADEVAWLAAAIPAVMRYAELCRAHPDLPTEPREDEYPSIPVTSAPLDPDTLEWRQWTVAAPPVAEVLALPDTALDARLRSLPIGLKQSIDLDWCYLPDGIAEGERPYHPRVIVSFDTAGGFCFAMDVISVTDSVVQRLGQQLFNVILQIGVIPTVVQVRRPELAQALGPALADFGCQVVLKDRLKSSSEFRRGMMQFIRQR